MMSHDIKIHSITSVAALGLQHKYKVKAGGPWAAAMIHGHDGVLDSQIPLPQSVGLNQQLELPSMNHFIGNSFFHYFSCIKNIFMI